MMVIKKQQPVRRTMAIYPMWKGIAFGVVDDQLRHVEHGIVRLAAKRREHFVDHLASLVDRHKANVLVVESVDGTRRGARAREQTAVAEQYASTHEVLCIRVSWPQVSSYFGESTFRGVADR